MRRTLAVVLATGVLLTWWFGQDLSVKAQAGPAAASENGDVNGDGGRDIADVVYLLNWLFDGGLAPVACAHPRGCDLTAEECELLKEDLAFARRVAGTYLLQNAGGKRTLVTFTADGGFIVSQEDEYFGGTAPDGEVVKFIGQGHGSWRRTDDREVTTVNLHFLADAAGVTKFIWKITAVRSFDDTFGEVTNEWTLDVYRGDQDPLDPLEVPVFIRTGIASGRRLE